MNAQRDIDLPWVAVDAAGRLAVFTTAGEGPVPSSALRVSAAAELAVAQLPVVGGTELLVNYPRPDDFLGWAERGLFAYDWSDVHRSSANSSGCYELVAKPLCPVTLGSLSPELRAPFEATVLAAATFGQTRVSEGQVAT
jgi:hypothetical protein